MTMAFCVPDLFLQSCPNPIQFFVSACTGSCVYMSPLQMIHQRHIFLGSLWAANFGLHYILHFFVIYPGLKEVERRRKKIAQEQSELLALERPRRRRRGGADSALKCSINAHALLNTEFNSYTTNMHLKSDLRISKIISANYFTPPVCVYWDF